MADSPPALGDSFDEPDTAGPPPRLPHWHRTALPWAAGVVAALAWAWLICLLAGAVGLRGAWGGWGAWALHVLIAVALVMVAMWQAVQRDVYWSRPLCR